MKKISVCGKGGSGKSTVVALLAHGLRDRGYRVLVVDSDESNPGLYRMLGFDRRPEPLLDLVGGKKKVFQTFSEEPGSSRSILTQEEIQVADIPGDYIVERDSIGLVCIGKILQSLEGCACPMGALSREFLKRLSLQKDEVAVVDMEAGIEHFGRGVETSIDSVLIVTEPSFDSLELAEKINALAAEVGVERVWTILNKIRSKEIASRLREELEERGISVIGSIGYEPEIFQSGLEGRPVRRDKVETDIGRILDQLL
ncbi:MAG TPA: P-loop NTPase [Thermoflexia bacterium]|nr:P-loop NTPase [Thermoflexia bacterium]